MGKKLQPKELESILKVLPLKEQAKIKEQELSPEWLRQNIDLHKRLMKRDLWFGPIWFLTYSVLLFTYGITTYVILIFLLGMVYFTYTIFKTGSYGLNKKRVQVFEQLLAALEK